jgi:peptide deformylase
MSKILDIIINPNPILRKKSRMITGSEIKTPQIQKLIGDMVHTMLEKDGAGLAAPQTGENIRLIVLRDEDQVFIMINPQITRKSWAKNVEEEGCLSVLDDKGQIIYANVERHDKIHCLYIDSAGKKQKLVAEKLLARIIQHETDHLDGILFIDKLYDQNKKRKS